jgi:hypothetical protein
MWQGSGAHAFHGKDRTSVSYPIGNILNNASGTMMMPVVMMSYREFHLNRFPSFRLTDDDHRLFCVHSHRKRCAAKH